MTHREFPDNEMLRLSGLSAGYENNTLFNALELSLFPGKLVCFMGPNGAGKSTLIRTLGGLQKPLEGSVRIRGNEGTSTEFSKQIALVLTDPVRDVNVSVYEMVSFGRYPFLSWNVQFRDADREIIESAIRQVNISDLRHRPVHELSDGQLQMTMIARALAQDTPIMILDEPTAHLDLNNRVEIMKLLQGLAHNLGKAILLATHELDLALQTADLIWLTGNDKNIITGIPEDLVLNGSFDQTFRFKGFDLKTGKVQHEVYRETRIDLTGEGYAFLWTRNALERNGFQVVDENGIRIAVSQKRQTLVWTIEDNHEFFSLGQLLDYLLNQSSQ